MPNSGLGRGLGSLIPNKVNPTSNKVQEKISEVNSETVVVDDKDKVLRINPEEIKVNPMQPRTRFVDTGNDELVESIKMYGIIQPLIVTKSEDGFELIAGERRLRASKQAGLDKVPVVVREAEEQEKLEVALVENLQRENLNPVETAVAYRKLMDEFNMSQEDVSKKVGKSRSAIANTLRMLNLPEEIQLALLEGKISEGHGKYLIGLESEVKQMALFRKILRNGLSVNDTNEEARRMGGTKQHKVAINYEDKDKEFKLREFFGAKTEIKRKKKGGQIIVDFYSDEELREIISKL